MRTVTCKDPFPWLKLGEKIQCKASATECKYWLKMVPRDQWAYTWCFYWISDKRGYVSYIKYIMTHWLYQTKFIVCVFFHTKPTYSNWNLVMHFFSHKNFHVFVLYSGNCLPRLRFSTKVYLSERISNFIREFPPPSTSRNDIVCRGHT